MPSPTIPQTYIDQFSRYTREVFQQKGSRLLKTITHDPLAAENGYFDFVGTMNAVERTGRAQEVILTPPPFSRRKCGNRTFEASDYVDKFEQKVVSSDLFSPTSKAFAYALGRQQDSMIIERALGVNYGGRDGTVAIPFDSANQTVAVDYQEDGTTGTNLNLTTGKMRLVLEKLTGAEALPDDDHAGITFVYTASQVHALVAALEQLKVTTVTLDALMSGKPDVAFMGMRFIRVNSQILPISGTVRTCLAYAQDSINWCNIQDLNTDTQWFLNKKSWLVSSDFQADAARLRENGVVQILCDESVII